MILEEFFNPLLPPVIQQTSETLKLFFLAQSLQFGQEIIDHVLGHVSALSEGCSLGYLVLTHTSRFSPSPHWIASYTWESVTFP